MTNMTDMQLYIDKVKEQKEKNGLSAEYLAAHSDSSLRTVMCFLSGKTDTGFGRVLRLFDVVGLELVVRKKK